jgi:hypothetical protein
LVDPYFVTRREKINGSFDVFFLVQALELGEHEVVDRNFVETFLRQSEIAGGSYDRGEYVQLIYGVVWIGLQNVRDFAEIERKFLWLRVVVWFRVGVGLLWKNGTKRGGKVREG